MQDKHLILIDLDGTALSDWQTMSEDTIKTIDKIQNLGNVVVIATGRPYRSSKVFYDLLHLKTPIINYNGALIHNPHDEKFDELSNEIELTHILKVFDDAGSLIENAFCEYYENIYIYKESEDIMPLVHPEGGKIVFGRFADTLRLNPNGFILLTYPGKHDEVEAYLKTHFDGILNSRNWGKGYEQIIEIYNPTSNKGFAMNVIADYYGIDKSKIIAFGDGENDIEMIQSAGIGVAMGNAIDRVKAVADFITRTNTENGVASFLKEYFKL